MLKKNTKTNTYKSEKQVEKIQTHKKKQIREQEALSLEEIFNNFYYKILYSYPFIGDYYINTML